MTILIPTPLRAFTGQKSTVEVDAANVKDALAKLTEAHPELKQHLFGAEGKLRSFVNVYVNDDESGKMELKAGSKQHQHIAAIDPEGNGTKFGLVALDLPGRLSFNDKDDKQTQ